MAYNWFIRDTETKKVLTPVCGSRAYAMDALYMTGLVVAATDKIYRLKDEPDAWRKYEFKKVYRDE